MKIYYKLMMIVGLVALMLSGCRKEEPSIAAPEQMVLIYAINHNNLSGDLVQNERQILSAMQNLNTDKYKVLVYKYTSRNSNPALFEVTKNNGEAVFTQVKEYDKSILSVNPERINDVIEDAIALYPNLKKDIFFWGHGNGWVNPNKYSASKEATSVDKENKLVAPQSFGGEYVDDNSTTTEYVDIDEMANAIPDNVFEAIWFDCCYMSSIEVAYQLRNKCNTYVAYPTEIMADGLPYSRVLPYVIESRDFKSAARELYLYYNDRSNPLPVTVAVMRMDKIEGLAEVSRRIFALGDVRPSTTGMQNYSRFSNAPYWDFGQYMREYIVANTSEGDALRTELKSELQSAIDDFVIYSAASDHDFNYYAKPILKENFSGLSAHNYVGGNSERETFYRKLDWFSATR